MNPARFTDLAKLAEGAHGPAGEGLDRTGSTLTAPRVRVLHCIGGLTGGGAERQLAYLAAGMSRKGVDMHVAYLHPGPNLSRIQDSGVTLHELHGRSNYDPSLLSQLIRI